MFGATHMPTSTSVGMDKQSRRSAPRPVFSRLGGRALLTLLVAGTGVLVSAQAVAQDFGRRQPARDTPAQTGGSADTANAAMISGRVVDGRTGQALHRARVVATDRETGSRRHTVQTDQTGRYVLSDLAAGRFTVTVSKPGYITLAYGQRRPRQPATPVEVVAGQHLQNLDLVLPAGSVITGHVVNENGAALPLATVRVLRYIYQQGQQQLVPVGTDRTDDRGQYRVFGLEPGNYFVSASVPHQLLNPSGGRLGPFVAGGRRPFAQAGGGFVQAGPGGGGQDTDPLGYAPSYYPGVGNLSDASHVTVGLSAEVGGVDFAVQLVPTATVGGVVLQPDGSPATDVQVMLIPDNGVPSRDSILGARIQGGGAFEIRNVPPGSYTLRAATRGGRRGGRAGFGGRPVFASQRLDVDGYDVSGITLALTPGATLTGSVAFETTQGPPSGMARVRVTAVAVQSVQLLGTAEGRIDEDGAFEMQNVSGGPRLIRARGVPDGWTLKAVYLDGRDVTDTPLEFSGVTRADGFRLVLTDQVSRISGLVQDREREPLTDFTVVAFSLDDSLWQPQSRHVKAARPDQNARYEIEGLPAGSYLIAAVDTVQEGEWFDPRFLRQLRSGGVLVSLSDGEAKDLNLALDRLAP